MAFSALIKAYTLSPTPPYPLLLTSLTTFLLGYIEYIYSFLLVIHDSRAPYPLWMHTLYFAHDNTWCVRLVWAARENDYHWFLVGTSIALLIWNAFEGFNLYMALTVEREEIWASLKRSPGTIRGQGKGKEKEKETAVGLTGPLIDVGLQIAGFYCVVNLLIGFLGEDSLFEWFLFTNIIIAWGPGTLWRTRGDRRGCSIGLAIVIVVGTANTFAPWSMWLLAMPERFDTWWFYASGVVFTGISIRNLFVVLGLKGKKWEKGDGKLIW